MGRGALHPALPADAAAAASARAKDVLLCETANPIATGMRMSWRSGSWIGEPHLGAAALICFEWLQRPENVLTGKITWPDYRGPEHPKHVRILHHKTGEVVLQPLQDGERSLYPELEAYLQSLPRLGTPIVVTKGSRGPSRPYAMVYAQARVRQARTLAGLADHVTLDACRHGGMTELGDAKLAEQGVMALSGHKTPQAARLYVKRTDVQRVAAARKRRSWVDKEDV